LAFANSRVWTGNDDGDDQYSAFCGLKQIAAICGSYFSHCSQAFAEGPHISSIISYSS